MAEGVGYEIFQDSWSDMSEVERNDFAEAGKCLLTQAWTAAVVVTLRGAEGVLRKFYREKTGEDPGRTTMDTLIRKLKKGDEEMTGEGGVESRTKILLDYLNYLRDKRNTAAHPGQIFDQPTAELVFMQSLALVQEIHKELQNK